MYTCQTLKWYWYSTMAWDAVINISKIFPKLCSIMSYTTTLLHKLWKNSKKKGIEVKVSPVSVQELTSPWMLITKKEWNHLSHEYANRGKAAYFGNLPAEPPGQLRLFLSIRESWESQIFPSEEKMGIILRIPKKGARLVACRCRQVNSLSYPEVH